MKHQKDLDYICFESTKLTFAYEREVVLEADVSCAFVNFHDKYFLITGAQAKINEKQKLIEILVLGDEDFLTKWKDLIVEACYQLAKPSVLIENKNKTVLSEINLTYDVNSMSISRQGNTLFSGISPVYVEKKSEYEIKVIGSLDKHKANLKIKGPSSFIDQTMNNLNQRRERFMGDKGFLSFSSDGSEVFEEFNSIEQIGNNVEFQLMGSCVARVNFGPAKLVEMDGLIKLTRALFHNECVNPVIYSSRGLLYRFKTNFNAACDPREYSWLFSSFENKEIITCINRTFVNHYKLDCMRTYKDNGFIVKSLSDISVMSESPVFKIKANDGNNEVEYEIKANDKVISEWKDKIKQTKEYEESCNTLWYSNKIERFEYFVLEGSKILLLSGGEIVQEICLKGASINILPAEQKVLIGNGLLVKETKYYDITLRSPKFFPTIIEVLKSYKRDAKYIVLNERGGKELVAFSRLTFNKVAEKFEFDNLGVTIFDKTPFGYEAIKDDKYMQVVVAASEDVLEQINEKLQRNDNRKYDYLYVKENGAYTFYGHYDNIKIEKNTVKLSRNYSNEVVIDLESSYVEKKDNMIEIYSGKLGSQFKDLRIKLFSNNKKLDFQPATTQSSLIIKKKSGIQVVSFHMINETSNALQFSGQTMVELKPIRYIKDNQFSASLNNECVVCYIRHQNMSDFKNKFDNIIRNMSRGILSVNEIVSDVSMVSVIGSTITLSDNYRVDSSSVAFEFSNQHIEGFCTRNGKLEKFCLTSSSSNIKQWREKIETIFPKGSACVAFSTPNGRGEDKYEVANMINLEGPYIAFYKATLKDRKLLGIFDVTHDKVTDNNYLMVQNGSYCNVKICHYPNFEKKIASYIAESKERKSTSYRDCEITIDSTKKFFFDDVQTVGRSVVFLKDGKPECRLGLHPATMTQSENQLTLAECVFGSEISGAKIKFSNEHYLSQIKLMLDQAIEARGHEFLAIYKLKNETLWRHIDILQINGKDLTLKIDNKEVLKTTIERFETLHEEKIKIKLRDGNSYHIKGPYNDIGNIIANST